MHRNYYSRLPDIVTTTVVVVVAHNSSLPNRSPAAAAAQSGTGKQLGNYDTPQVYLHPEPKCGTTCVKAETNWTYSTAAVELLPVSLWGSMYDTTLLLATI